MTRSPAIQNHRTWLALLLLTLLAGWLRLRQLNTLPPGFWFDEAWVTLAARDAGVKVYYDASFGGMHPAVVYLTRLGQFFSDDPRLIRVMLALVGTLSVPLAFFTFHAIFARSRTSQAEQSALIGAFGLTILYSFFHFSRLGFESMLPVPAALLAFWLLAQPPGRWRTVALGIVLGVSIYTFDTGRFIPIAVAAAFWLAPPTENPRPWGQQAADFGLMTVIALLVGSPLLHFFWTHWDQLTARAAVTTFNTLGPGAESVPLALLRNLGRTLGGLSLPGWGDQIARHNLPGRPVFDPFLSILFWLGAVKIFRDGLARPKRSFAAVTLWCWLGIGLLPVVLTDGAPTYTRIFVAVPPLAAAVGLGASWLIERGDQLYPRLGSLTVVVLLLLAFHQTMTDYFGRWAATPELYEDFQVAQWEIAQFGQTAGAAQPLYFVPQTPYQAEPTYDLIPPAPLALPRPPCLLLPPAGQTTLLLFDQRLAPEAIDAYAALYPAAERQTPLRHPLDGQALARTLTVTADTPPQLPGRPLPATFGQRIELERWAWDGESLILVWQALAEPVGEQTLFVHVYRRGEENAPPQQQIDRPACYPTSRWQTGQQLVDAIPLALPDGLTAAEVTIALGWYDPQTGVRLPLVTATGTTLPDERLVIPLRP